MLIFECIRSAALSLSRRIAYLRGPRCGAARGSDKDGVSRRGDGRAGRGSRPGRKDAAARIRRDFRPHHPGRQGFSRHRRRSRQGKSAGADARPGRGRDQDGAWGDERGRHADCRGRARRRRRFAWPDARRRASAPSGPRRPRDPAHPWRQAHHRGGLRKGRRRQVDGRLQSRRRPRQAWPQDRRARRGPVRPLDAKTVRHHGQARPRPRRQEAHPARGLRRQGHVDRLPDRGGRAGDLARADGDVGLDPAPARGRVGRARRFGRRHAAGHRRHPV